MFNKYLKGQNDRLLDDPVESFLTNIVNFRKK